MVTFVQVLGTETGDTSPGVLLFFDNRRYLFNCGEGTQRICTEHKVRFPKLDHIFFTRLRWKSVGGLPGMTMTVADTGLKRLALFGPPEFHQYLYATRSFLYRRTMDVQVTEFTRSAPPESHFNQEQTPLVNGGLQQSLKPTTDSWKFEQQGFFKDDLVTIWPIMLDPESKLQGGARKRCRRETENGTNEPMNGEGEVDGDYLTPHLRNIMLRHITLPGSGGDNRGVEGERCISRQEQAKREVEGIPLEGGKTTHTRENLVPRGRQINVAVCYVAQTAPIPGKFDPAKAKELKVPRGPLYGQLVKGDTITLDDGRVIHPHDVVGKSIPGPVVMIVDCPSEDHADCLEGEGGFEPYYAGAQHGKQPPVVVVHMTPHEVLQTPTYQKWATRFGPTTHHIIVNSQVCSNQVVFKSSYEMQCRLSTLDPTVFPVPYHDGADKEATNQARLDQLIKDGFPRNTSRGAPLLKYHLIPTKKNGLDRTEQIAQTPTEDLVKQTRNLEAGRGVMGLGRPVVVVPGEHQFRHTDKDVEVQLLGTGSAMPAKYRNVSSSLVNIKGKGIILLDSGEGTYGQLCRRYGYEQIDSLMASIKCAYISHMHADHHLGLVRILAERPVSLARLGQKSEPLLVIGPRTLGTWLAEYSRLEPLEYSFVDGAKMGAAEGPVDEKTESHLLSTLGATLRTVFVKHCIHATGCVVTGADGWSVVYSGDTRPCESLVTRGKGASLLLHEATFEDELQSEAIDKNHSTTLEAVRIGAQMGAGLTVLTHFSQRYPKIPRIDPAFSDQTAIGFDLVSIAFKDMPKMPLFTEALKVIFADEHADLQDDE